MTRSAAGKALGFATLNACSWSFRTGGIGSRFLLHPHFSEHELSTSGRILSTLVAIVRAIWTLSFDAMESADHVDQIVLFSGDGSFVFSGRSASFAQKSLGQFLSERLHSLNGIALGAKGVKAAQVERPRPFSKSWVTQQFRRCGEYEDQPAPVDR
jgi:hypothetical protein